MKIVFLFLLCLLVTFIAMCLVFLAIRKIRKGWLIFWFLQGIVCPLLFFFGILFIKGAFGPYSLRGWIEPCGILLFVILCQFVWAALDHIRFVALFLYHAKSRLTKSASREKAEDLFIEPAW